MSFILDALQKSQAEQNANAVSLNPRPRVQRRAWLPWVVASIVILVLANTGIWLFVYKPGAVNVQSANATSINQDVPSTSAQPSTPQPADLRLTAAQSGRSQTEANEPSNPLQNARTRTNEVSNPSTAQTTVSRNDLTVQSNPQLNSPPQTRPTRPTSRSQRLSLSALPSNEQVLYNGFNYSTHIYTDDPSLCAIVIDGVRLKQGDAFKGLKVVEINETGVVFAETRGGVQREIEVVIAEQWDS